MGVGRPSICARSNQVCEQLDGAAVWTYSHVHAQGAAGDVLGEFCDLIEPYWPPERRYVDDGYRSLAFPFDELEPPRLEMHAHWTAAQLVLACSCMFTV